MRTYLMYHRNYAHAIGARVLYIIIFIRTIDVLTAEGSAPTMITTHLPTVFRSIHTPR